MTSGPNGASPRRCTRSTGQRCGGRRKAKPANRGSEFLESVQRENSMFNSRQPVEALDTHTANIRGKRLLITGGTGSFGNVVLKRFLAEGIDEIRVFSRDEKKQEDM